MCGKMNGARLLPLWAYRFASSQKFFRKTISDDRYADKPEFLGDPESIMGVAYLLTYYRNKTTEKNGSQKCWNNIK